MKKSFLFLIVIFIFIIKINAQFFPEPDGPSDFFKTKKKEVPGFWNCHSQTTSYLAAKQNSSNRRFKYKLAFWNECWGNTSDDDCGWSKVGRVHFRRNSSPNKNKLHVGWRSDINNEYIIKLSAFFHEVPNTSNWNHYFVSHYITNVHTDHWVNIDMFLGLEIIALIIDNKAIGISKSGWIPSTKTSKLARTFWFGGECCPPRDMAVLFDEQQYDYTGFNNHFNSVDVMTWNITEFDYGDEGVFYAYDEIHGSISNEDAAQGYVQYQSGHPNPDKQKCIISSGADITFSAGKKVILHPGFHAKPGSHFIAKILQKKKYPGYYLEPEKLNLPPLEQGNCGELSDYVSLSNESDINNKESNISTNFSLNKFHIFSIYPNPNPGIFNLEIYNNQISSYSVEVFNIMNKLVYKEVLQTNKKIQIDISDEPRGVYFVKVILGENVYTEKIIYK